jgi:hypothetical protein
MLTKGPLMAMNNSPLGDGWEVIAAIPPNGYKVIFLV